MGRTVMQFDKDDLDVIGVPKFDFLALGALSMVRLSFDVIERRTGTRPTMYGFRDRDKALYDLIQRGETMGMFQIRSRAQINSRAAHQARSPIRPRRADRAHSTGSDPGEVRAFLHGAADNPPAGRRETCAPAVAARYPCGRLTRRS
jgi:hypothetical protein